MKFDHIEAHVDDIKKYCDFLCAIFKGGSVEVLTDCGISMFTSPEGVNVEVKKRTTDQAPIWSGFCCPCLRMDGAKDFIEKDLGYKIMDTRQTLDGFPVYFFNDYEGITWHIKDIPETAAV